MLVLIRDMKREPFSVVWVRHETAGRAIGGQKGCLSPRWTRWGRFQRNHGSPQSVVFAIVGNRMASWDGGGHSGDQVWGGGFRPVSADSQVPIAGLVALVEGKRNGNRS